MRKTPFKKLDDNELAAMQAELRANVGPNHTIYIRRGWKGPEIVSRIREIPVSRAEKINSHRAEQDTLHTERIKALKPVIDHLKSIWGKKWRTHLE
jgi:hypothetical protein